MHECNGSPGNPGSSRLLLTGIDGERPSPALGTDRPEHHASRRQPHHPAALHRLRLNTPMLIFLVALARDSVAKKSSNADKQPANCQYESDNGHDREHDPCQIQRNIRQAGSWRRLNEFQIPAHAADGFVEESVAPSFVIQVPCTPAAHECPKHPVRQAYPAVAECREIQQPCGPVCRAASPDLPRRDLRLAGEIRLVPRGEMVNIVEPQCSTARIEVGEYLITSLDL